MSDALLLGAAGWGQLVLCWGIGSIVSSVYLTFGGLDRHRGRMFLGLTLLFGVAVLGFSLSRWLPLVFFFNALAGFSFMGANIAGLAIVQALVPNRYLGRVTGLLMRPGPAAEIVPLEGGALDIPTPAARKPAGSGPAAHGA